jgi:small-conductance mechanosensitive channel
MGVSLVALRGNTDWEDVLLNLAGVCAPVVAFVPYPRPGTCGSVLTDAKNRLANIDNNMLGLLVAGGLGLLVVGVLTHLSLRSARPDRPGPVALLGFWAIGVLFLATTAVYAWDRTFLLDHGHDIAAGAMFGFIFVNVWLNAAALHETNNARARRSLWRNRYTVVGTLMVVAVVANFVARLAGYRWWVLTLEASMIVLFAWFWVAQTIELWNQGLRGRPVRRPDVIAR